MIKTADAWDTVLPMAFLAVTTTYAAWLKLVDPDPRVGFLGGANAVEGKLAAGWLWGKALESAPKLIFNHRLNAIAGPGGVLPVGAGPAVERG